MDQTDTPIEENKKMFSQEEMEILQKERDEYLAGWQRARADYLNFQKEENERFARFKKNNLEDVMRDFLTVLDSFEAAKRSLQDPNVSKELERIESQMRSIMKRYGVEEVNVSIGSELDPTLHEALESVLSDNPSGSIVEVLQNGYFLNGKIIRTTKVKVAQ